MKIVLKSMVKISLLGVKCSRESSSDGAQGSAGRILIVKRIGAGDEPGQGLLEMGIARVQWITVAPNDGQATVACDVM